VPPSKSLDRPASRGRISDQVAIVENISLYPIFVTRSSAICSNPTIFIILRISNIARVMPPLANRSARPSHQERSVIETSGKSPRCAFATESDPPARCAPVEGDDGGTEPVVKVAIIENTLL